MIDTEGYVLLDYDGKAVSIEDGKKYYWDADDGQHWNPETLQFEDDEQEDEYLGFNIHACGCCGYVDSDSEWEDRAW